METLDLDSLDYEIRFERGKELKVGCQTISKGDILELREWLNKLEFPKLNLPEKFSIYVGNKEMGRVIVKFLMENSDIRVHGIGNIVAAMNTFESCFADKHVWYNVKNNDISGDVCVKHDELTLKEVFNAFS